MPARRVGDILETMEEISVEWRVTNFFSLSEEVDVEYHSPSFWFLGMPWCLKMRPNGKRTRGNEGWIAVHLRMKHILSPVTVACSIGLKTADGKKHKDKHFTHVFESITSYGFATFVKRSELVEKKTTLVPFDVLTIACSVKKHVPGLVSRPKELSRDLGDLLKDETDSDVIVRVEAEEFRLHRKVLGARSPVFAAMFRHETEEKTTGVVSIRDCRADVFRSFTHYLYTGKVEGLSADIVFDLFKVADKYQVTELAEDCVNYMKDTLEVNTFCDAVEVALNHNNDCLMKPAMDLLSNKVWEIIGTEQWKRFLLQNPLQANELLKKVFDNVIE